MATIDYNKHIWEEWTLSDFIKELSLTFNCITEGRSKNKQMKLFLENIKFYQKEDIVNFLININNGSK